MEKEKGQSGCACRAAKTATENQQSLDTNKDISGLIRLCAGAAIFAGAVIYGFLRPGVFEGAPKLAVFLAAWLLSGGEVLFKALRNITRGRVFDENFLMSLAAAGAFAIGEYAEGTAVMIFYRIGEAIEERAVKRSSRSISALMDIRPDYASLKRGGEIVKVNPADVKPGDLVVVKPGEKIPLDGVVVEGSSALDTSALSGEALPRDARAGDEVLSGSINMNGLLVISVTKEYGDSTVSKILELVKNAANRKAAVENFITKFAGYYTPVVVLSAAALAALPPLIIDGARFSEWLNRALVFLVVSCPCALVVSIPLSFFGGIGGASKQGILFKGSNYLSALNDTDTVVFDKTGTLTRGVFSLSEIHCENKLLTREELLYYAAAAESNSNHPIALSIVKAYGKQIDPKAVSSHEETAGMGIRALVDGKAVLAGNTRFMSESGVVFSASEAPGTVVYISIDGVYSGCLVITDKLKSDSRRAVAGLKKAGIRRIVMLSGDNRAAAEKAGAETGINEIYAELLPHQKVERLEILQNEVPPGKKLLFAGDGVNDAPALARCDIGVAMGGLGSDAAIEAADIVLLTDEPSKLISALNAAKKTRAIVRQNIVFSLGVKALILALGALGVANLWWAVFGDVGVTLIAVLNAMRALSSKSAAA